MGSITTPNQMKKYYTIILLLLLSFPVYASHIAGGELFYEYVGPGSTANSSRYKVTMRLFRDCNSAGQVLTAETVTIGIYNRQTGNLVNQLGLNLQPIQTIQLNTAAIPCLVNPPDVCFQIGVFTNTIDLPNIDPGYTLIWIRCCRSDMIANMALSTGVGATFVTNIPGNTVLPTGHNSSPQFLVKDTALVCKQKSFILDFGATDADGDSLSYEFCDAYGGGTSSAPNPGPSPTLQLNGVSYKSPFTGNNPLGVAVSIDPKTGRITGTAPNAGRYVINVCVNEWRNGVILNEHRKDFILQVGNCDYAAADPLPQVGEPSIPQFNYEFISCKSFTVYFINNTNSSVITSYHWDFGVDTTLRDTSNLATPSYTYPDSGTFTIKLRVSGSNSCIDSNSVTIGIYPGFKGDFNVTGNCFKNPFIFTDKSSTTYGTINTWRWNFGDVATLADTSRLQNPSYIYPNQGTRNATLLVTDSKGCIDTVTKPIIVRDVPFLFLPFHDTIICSIDTLQLHAQGTGIFSWTPAYNLINAADSNPFVYPKITTTYQVSLLENSCIAKDTIRVNVVDSISIDAGPDTTICSSDILILKPSSEGLAYYWTPTTGIVSNPNIKNPSISLVFNPYARKDTTVVYSVRATLGKCEAKDQIKIKAVRYPIANAGLDDSICYKQKINLSATILGADFVWFPKNSLTNSNTLTPTASPQNTTTYKITVTDTLGCPKPISDEVIIKVIPQVIAYAGHDTNIVVNQPLQLHAEGGTNYAWTPTTGLNNPFTSDPIAILGPGIDSIRYTVRVTSGPGCFGEDNVKVVVFKTSPDIFVPSGFTPNGDGKNDVLKPILVGLKGLDFFRIYNRLGQLLYFTNSVGEGWDGKFQATEQATGTFVYMAQATDYLGKTIFRKGTVVLIR